MLTSIVSYEDRNKWGDSNYRGNCSGELIKELLDYFKPKMAFDPMVGGGTFKDVCEDLQIDNICRDLNPKWGGWNALEDEIEQSSDFIFWHPPYHNIIKYSGNMWGEPDKRDLSRCIDYNDYIKKLNKVQARLITSLRKNGRIAILIGDIKKNGTFRSIQKDMAWYGKAEQVIIKVQHNCASYRKQYSGKFIPIMHEYVLIFKKEDCYIVSTKTTYNINIDLRNSNNQTWREVVFSAMEYLGGKVTLEKLYEEIRFHSKAKNNVNWKEQVRKVLQIYKDFIKVSRGVYKIAV